MRICIDSCVFIRGLRDPSTDAAQLLAQTGPSLEIFIPRLVAREVTRNLLFPSVTAQFYRLFHNSRFAHIVDEPVPDEIFQGYLALGLNVKGDAYIGAFAEWMQVDYLISDNRHFLRRLRTDAYQLLSPGDFLDLLRKEPKS